MRKVALLADYKNLNKAFFRAYFTAHKFIEIISNNGDFSTDTVFLFDQFNEKLKPIAV